MESCGAWDCSCAYQIEANRNDRAGLTVCLRRRRGGPSGLTHQYLYSFRSLLPEHFFPACGQPAEHFQIIVSYRQQGQPPLDLYIEKARGRECQLLDLRRPVVETDLQAYRSALDEIGFDPGLAEKIIESRGTALPDKGKIPGVQMCQHLVVLEDDDRREASDRLVVNDRAGETGIEEAPDE